MTKHRLIEFNNLADLNGWLAIEDVSVRYVHTVPGTLSEQKYIVWYEGDAQHEPPITFPVPQPVLPEKPLQFKFHTGRHRNTKPEKQVLLKHFRKRKKK